MAGLPRVEYERQMVLLLRETSQTAVARYGPEEGERVVADALQLWGRVAGSVLTDA